MSFTRQIFRHDFVDYERFIDTDFSKSDPCLNCSLPFECDETAKECKYVQITGRRPSLEEESDERFKKDLLAILLALGETEPA